MWQQRGSALLCIMAPEGITAGRPVARASAFERTGGNGDKAVAAVKADKAKALDMFNKGEGGFKDRDLYVFCANASDGVMTAHPTHKGEQLADIKGKKGFPLGQEMTHRLAQFDNGHGFGYRHHDVPNRVCQESTENE